MAGCCNYDGTCRACLQDGKFWFSTDKHSSCCAFQPRICGESIGRIAETLKDCNEPEENTTVVVSGVVLAVFFVLAIAVVILLVKRGGIPTFFRRVRRDEMTPIIPMVRFSRSASVYSLDLAENDDEL